MCVPLIACESFGTAPETILQKHTVPDDHTALAPGTEIVVNDVETTIMKTAVEGVAAGISATAHEKGPIGTVTTTGSVKGIETVGRDIGAIETPIVNETGIETNENTEIEGANVGKMARISRMDAMETTESSVREKMTAPRTSSL